MNLRPANACDFARLFDIHQSVFRSHIEKFLGWDEDWQRKDFALECAAAETSVGLLWDGRAYSWAAIADSALSSGVTATVGHLTKTRRWAAARLDAQTSAMLQ